MCGFANEKYKFSFNRGMHFTGKGGLRGRDLFWCRDETTYVQQRLHGSLSCLVNPLDCLLASVVGDFPFSWHLGWMQEENALWRADAPQSLRFGGLAFEQLLLASAACLNHYGCVLFCNCHVEIGRVGIKGFLCLLCLAALFYNPLCPVPVVLPPEVEDGGPELCSSSCPLGCCNYTPSWADCR